MPDQASAPHPSMSVVGKAQQFLEARQFLWWCFLAFLAIRLALIWLVPVEPFSDAAWYYARAVTLAAEGTYSEGGIPTAYWPVGYPAALGLLFRLTGPSLLAAQIANLVLAACTFWLFYGFTKRLFGSEATARVAVLMLTFYPNNAAYVPLVLTETFYVFLLLLACVALLAKGRIAHFVLAGTILGFATLVKTQTLLLAPLLGCVSALDRFSWWSAARGVAIGVSVFIMGLLVVTPWTLRNHDVLGAFVLVSTNGGISLLVGNNPSVVGNYSTDFSEQDPLVAKAGFSVADQVAADRRARGLAMTWIRENPWLFVSMIPQKIFRLWAPDGEAEWAYQAGTPWYEENRVWFRAVRVFNQAFYIVVLVLAALGGMIMLRTGQRPQLYVGFLVAAYFTLISIAFSGQSRYHFPVMPFLIAHAAWFLCGPRQQRIQQYSVPFSRHK